MTWRILLLSLRSVAVIAGVGLVLIYARQYLPNNSPGNFPIAIHGVLSLVALWVAVWHSMRPLLAELRNTSVPASQICVAAPAPGTGDGYAESVHKYPLRLRTLLIVSGLLLIALPFLIRASHANTAPMTYPISFVGAAALSFLALRVALFSVTIKGDRLLVKAFTSREIRFEEIERTSVVTTRNGRQIVVWLKGGKVFRFGCLLSRFETMESVLMNEARA